MIVDDDPTVRAALSTLLDVAGDLQLLATASGAAIAHALLAMLGRDRPQV